MLYQIKMAKLGSIFLFFSIAIHFEQYQVTSFSLPKTNHPIDINKIADFVNYESIYDNIFPNNEVFGKIIFLYLNPV